VELDVPKAGVRGIDGDSRFLGVGFSVAGGRVSQLGIGERATDGIFDALGVGFSRTGGFGSSGSETDFWVAGAIRGLKYFKMGPVDVFLEGSEKNFLRPVASFFSQLPEANTGGRVDVIFNFLAVAFSSDGDECRFPGNVGVRTNCLFES
jgi:hypothetical protein